MHLYAFDAEAFTHCSGLHLAPGPVDKLGVVFDTECPSDLDCVMSFAGSVVRLDNGDWRMYYSVRRRDPHEMGLAVAESPDGIHWTRPPLGQMRCEGEDSNRLVIDGLYDKANIIQPQVVRLPDGRWRMYCWLHGQHRGLIRYAISESDDGLRWTALGLDCFAVLHPSDREVGQNGWVAGLTTASATDKFADQRTLDWMTAKRLRSNDATYVYYDDERGLFEMYSVWLVPNSPETRRHVPHDNAPGVLRTIHRRTSEDGLDWGAPELIITPDEHDPLDMQFYYLSVHREPEWRVGFLGHYRCWAQTMDIELCFSRDGRHWDRPLRGGWIPRDPMPQRGCMSAYATSALIDRGESWLMLYTAGNTKHNQQLPSGVEKPWRGVMGASIPKERFAGLATAPRVVGRLALRPFIPTDGEVRVNAAVRGFLRAELCDPFGAPLAGFEMDKCLAVQGDAADHVLRWEGDKTTLPYQYDAVSLRLEMADAELYALRA